MNNSAYNQLTGINIPIGGGKFVKLPFLGNPYFMGFWVLPQMAMHEAFQNGAPGQTFDMTKQALMQELPFQGTTMIDPGQIVLSAAVPDVLQPLISTTINKNLYNWTDLVSTTLAKLPASEQFSRGTSGLAVQIAKGLGAMGIEVSPIHIDNYLRGYLSSSYTQSTQTLDFLTQQLGMKWNPVKPDGNILNIAGLSAFIAQASPSSSFEVMQAASSYNQYQTYDTAWKLMIKDGRITEASQFYKDHQAELINFQVLKGFKSALTNLQNVYYKIQDNPRLSQEEAKTQSDNISNQIFDMAQRTNDVLSQYESHK